MFEDVPIEEAFRRCLPTGVWAAVSWVRAEATTPWPEELLGLETASEARRQEFVTARNCARAALFQAGVEGSALLRDDRGFVRWPGGWLGSITHSKGLCVAAVGATSEFTALGIDLERMDRLSASAMRRVVHPAETDFVANDQSRSSLLFSLKEAFYKSQFPVFRKEANFMDLALEVDLDSGEAEVLDLGGVLAEDLSLKQKAWRFRFCLRRPYVFTLCWVEGVGSKSSSG